MIKQNILLYNDEQYWKRESEEDGNGNLWVQITVGVQVMIKILVDYSISNHNWG